MNMRETKTHPINVKKDEECLLRRFTTQGYLFLLLLLKHTTNSKILYLIMKLSTRAFQLLCLCRIQLPIESATIERVVSHTQSLCLCILLYDFLSLSLHVHFFKFSHIGYISHYCNQLFQGPNLVLKYVSIFFLCLCLSQL